MPTRNAPPSGPGNQPEHEELASSRFLVRWFRSALLEVGGATKSGRAHGRFDEIARHDADTRQQWVGYSIEMCRAQLYAAAAEGPDAKAETIRRIERAAEEWKRACLSGFVEEPGVNASLPDASLHYTEQATEALVAVQRFSLTRSESDAERARRETLDVVNASTMMLALVGRVMRPLRQVR